MMLAMTAAPRHTPFSCDNRRRFRGAPLLSTSDSRTNGVPAILRRDIQVVPPDPAARGKARTYIVKDPARAALHEFTENEFRIIELLGEDTLPERVCAELHGRFGQSAAPHEVTALHGRLRRLGLLAGQEPKAAVPEGVPPLLRPDLQVVYPEPAARGKNRAYTVKDPASGALFTFGEHEFRLIELLGESRAPDEVARDFFGRFARRVSPHEVAALLAHLRELGLLREGDDADPREGEGRPAILRADLKVVRPGPTARGKARTYLVKDPVAETIVEFSEAEFRIIELLGEGAEPEQVAAQCRARYQQRVQASEVVALHARLRKLSLLHGPVPPQEAVAPAPAAEPPPIRRSSDLGLLDEVVAPHPSREARAEVAVVDQPEPAPAPTAAVAEPLPGADWRGHRDHRHGGRARPARRGARGPTPAAESTDPAAASDTAPAAAPAEPPRGHRHRPELSEEPWGAAEQGRKRRFLQLFNPNHLFESLADWLWPLRYLVYTLPLLFPLALIALLENGHLLAADAERLLKPMSAAQHLLFGLLTVNLFSKVVSGTVCRYFGAEVNGFGLVFVFGIIPRFAVSLRRAWELPRKARMWVFGAPLLFKLLLFCAGVLVWLNTRGLGNQIGPLALTLASMALVSFAFTAIPLLKGDGYWLLGAYLGTPQLRARVVHDLTHRAEEGGGARPYLVSYLSASLLLSLFLVGVFFIVVAAWLQMTLHGAGVVIALLLFIYLARRVVRYGQAVYEGVGKVRSGETVASGEAGEWQKRVKLQRRVQASGQRRLRGLLVLMAVPLLFLPYRYEASGPFTLLPALRQEIHVDIPGLVAQVLYAGGERLAAGTPIARLETYDYENNVQVTQARILEVKAQIDELVNTPRPEEVELAKVRLEEARVRANFSAAELKRFEQLYKEHAVSFEELENVRRRKELEQSQVVEEQARLTLLKAGTHPDKIAASRAELERLTRQLAFYQEQLARTELKMPFDGTLLTLNLHDKRGQYLDKGDLFTEVENTGHFNAQVEIPETDIAEVAVGAPAALRTWAHPQRVFTGQVVQIEPQVVERPFGNVVRVQVRLENEAGILRSGMSGYGKVQSRERPLWDVLTRVVVRFFMVEMWSWIP